MHGTVEFFNNIKGWGKIIGADNNSYFVHHRDITDKKFYVDNFEKFRTLRPGQLVEFEPDFLNRPNKMNPARNIKLVIIK